MTAQTYYMDDCTFAVPAGFRDHTVNALDWPTEDGGRVALVVQRQALPHHDGGHAHAPGHDGGDPHPPTGDAAPRPGALERFVDAQTRDYGTRFEGFHKDREEATSGESGLEMRRLAFRWRHEQEVLYHHQAFVLVGWTVLVLSCTGKARNAGSVDHLMNDVLAELRVRNPDGP